MKDRHLHSGDLTIICDAHSQKSGALALIHMNYEYDINIDHVSKLFFLKYHIKWKKQVFFFFCYNMIFDHN